MLHQGPFQCIIVKTQHLNCNIFFLCGYVYDEETGLYYLQSRYYDPEIGRFLNADAFASTGQGFTGNNMFAYCLNNPANNEDPFGFYVVSDDPLRWPVWIHIGGNASGVSSASPSAGPDGIPLPFGGIIQSVIDIFRNQSNNEKPEPSYSRQYNYNGLKNEQYVQDRGWTDEMIQYAMKAGTSGTSVNAANNNSCTAYLYPGTNNQYVVIDDTTGSIVQVSDFNDPGWIVDFRIQWTP